MFDDADIWELMHRQVGDYDCTEADYKTINSIKIRRDELRKLKKIHAELSNNGAFVQNRMVRLAIKFFIYYYENIKSPTPRKK